MSAQPRLATVDYLAEVAKDWALSSFASAPDDRFTLATHRFEFDGTTVQRRRLRRGTREAADPLTAAGATGQPIAWARSATATLLADDPSGSIDYQQEIVEVVALEDGDLLAEAAFVVRIPGLPPCLGRFFTVLDERPAAED